MVVLSFEYNLSINSPRLDITIFVPQVLDWLHEYQVEMKYDSAGKACGNEIICNNAGTTNKGPVLILFGGSCYWPDCIIHEEKKHRDKIISAHH